MLKTELQAKVRVISNILEIANTLTLGFLVTIDIEKSI